MSELQHLRWEGDTAYCGKAKVAEVQSWASRRSFVYWCLGVYARDVEVDSVEAGRSLIETRWESLAADLTAQPEPAEQKVKAWWMEDDPKCFTLVDEDDLPCGKIWSQGSVWMWALDEESYWPADSESEAKQALLEAVGAEVITLPENLTTLENADTGHDQPKGA